MAWQPIPEETETVARKVVDAAFAVHNELGPGLLESVYESCLCYELSQRGLTFQRQPTVPISYRGVRMEAEMRPDLIVENGVLLELKAVEEMLPLFESQLLTYLKITRIRLGLLINFNVPLIKQGIKRMVL